MPDSAANIRLRLLGARDVERGADRVSRSLRGVDRASGRADRAIGRTTRGFAGVSGRVGRATVGLGMAGFSGAAVGAGAAAFALGGEVVRATKGFSDHMKVVRQSRAVVKSTGGVANVSAAEIGALSDAIERKTSVDGDLVQSGANVLATFTNVRNESGRGNKVFTQTVAAATDMAAALGTDTSGAAMQLGKALNDPEKGLTRLTRSGVTFTDQQSDQVKALVAAGKTMEAQKIILREVNKEFGGSAKAQATPWTRLLVPIHALEDRLGGAVLPYLERGSRLGTRFLTRIDQIAGKDVDFGEKLKLSGVAAREVFGPLVREGRATVARMHLDDKLEDAVEAAAPRIANGVAHAAPRAAKAFLNAFLEADAWGKGLTGAILFAKLGGAKAFGSLGSKALGAMFGGRSGGIAGAVSRKSPVPVIVMNKGFGGAPGSPKGKGGPSLLRSLGEKGPLLSRLGAVAAGAWAVNESNKNLKPGTAARSTGDSIRRDLASVFGGGTSMKDLQDPSNVQGLKILHGLLKSGAIDRGADNAYDALKKVQTEADRLATTGAPRQLRTFAAQVSRAGDEADNPYLRALGADLGVLARRAAVASGDVGSLKAALDEAFGAVPDPADTGDYSDFTGPASDNAPSTRRPRRRRRAGSQDRRGHSLPAGAAGHSVATGLGRGARDSVTVNNVVTLDGREVHRSVVRHERLLQEAA